MMLCHLIDRISNGNLQTSIEMPLNLLSNSIFYRLSKGEGYTVRLYIFFLMLVHQYFFEE